MVLFLVGYMGCGKSTIGRALARRLGWEFMDMDSRIEQSAAKSVTEIFADEGEDGFRRREREFLESLEGKEVDAVVATGGGVPCYAGNMELIRRVGQSVYMKMSPERLVGRITERGRLKRPLIKDMDDGQLLEFITRNLAIREPFYAQAGMTIDCHGVSDDYIATHIERYIELIKNKYDSTLR